ncbi:MAG: hypothetical protein A2005_11770 [Desulfuromonadales bacterium GWC2_61_20]|nr:MAG: hypothetical protein A2005_11770 [Desulfuromonadales bacterium GWC2_61_20]HAD04551.1 hypothetical protein [Desulfuromonas sp.]
MSGLYLLALIAIWLLAGWIIYRVWRIWKPTDLTPKIVHIVIGVLLFLVWFGGAFWEVVGKKEYYDAQVRELCAKDGGVKVYETVELPGERFDKYGVVKIPSGKDVNLGTEYHYDSKIYYYKKMSPEVWRLHFEIFRNLDNKLLGEATSYARRGGDIPGPWHESSFGCPEQSDISDLKKQVFIKIGTGVRHE